MNMFHIIYNIFCKHSYIFVLLLGVLFHLYSFNCQIVFVSLQSWYVFINPSSTQTKHYVAFYLKSVK